MGRRIGIGMVKAIKVTSKLLVMFLFFPKLGSRKIYVHFILFFYLHIS